MESIVEKMMDETNGVPVKTVKSFISKIPSVFTGNVINLQREKEREMGRKNCNYKNVVNFILMEKKNSSINEVSKKTFLTFPKHFKNVFFAH